MATLKLFASAREAAGTSSVNIDATTVDELLQFAVDTYGSGLKDVLSISRIWLNGEPADLKAPITKSDEVAVLPPVSGGMY